MKKIRSIEELDKLRYVYRSELAVLAGLPESTIKHWVEFGLLPPSQVNKGGHKLFNKDVMLDTIYRIIKLKQKGWSLYDIYMFL